jgi:quercetin dioxygenase-like cupin family protein
MNEAASEADFEVQLRAEGYTKVETKEYAPRGGHGRHRHHFAVEDLVLSGAFIVQHGDDPVTFSPGDVFTVAYSALHDEWIGPAGAKVLVGRKFQQ